MQKLKRYSQVIFFKKRYSFLKKVSLNTSLLLWIKNKQYETKRKPHNTTARIESEMQEKRTDRLAVVRQNTTARIELETSEKRAERLDVLRQNATERVASETAEERQNRLVSMRTNLAETIENECVRTRRKT